MQVGRVPFYSGDVKQKSNLDFKDGYLSSICEIDKSLFNILSSVEKAVQLKQVIVSDLGYLHISNFFMQVIGIGAK